MTIAYLDAYGPQSYYDILFEDLPSDISLLTLPTKDVATRVQTARACDVLIAGSTTLPAEIIKNAPNLKFVHHFGVGYQDTLDVELLKRHGIRLAITPVGTTETVAEQALMLMLSTQRRLPALDRDTREGNFRSTDFAFDCFGMLGQTIGIVGMGRIGQAVVERLRGFGVTIVFYDPFLPAGVEIPGTTRVDALEDLLQVADLVSIHVPLTPDTRHLIDAQALALMKPTAILINTARGPLVDEGALVDALSSGAIFAAGLDVFETEPPGAANPLFALPNVVLTPHSAGKNRGAIRAKARFVYENIHRFVEGESLVDEINLS